MMMPAQTMQALQKTPFEGCAEMNIQKGCCFLFYPYTDHITENLMFSKTDFFLVCAISFGIFVQNNMRGKHSTTNAMKCILCIYTIHTYVYVRNQITYLNIANSSHMSPPCTTCTRTRQLYNK